MTIDNSDCVWQRTQRITSDFSSQLIAWQQVHGRHTLPWQNTQDPYRVWLSEIMLQQTQVVTVLAYYEKFLERFPTVTDLANASQDEVLTLWAGLGYYSRARNLHRCAQDVRDRFAGQFPSHAEDLETLSGIGRSTAAAIASFCFGEKVAILDGNVKRVLTRVLAFDGDMASNKEVNRLWEHATALLPDHSMPAYTQGMMDLGATVCITRNPHCLICPVNNLCVAQKEGSPERYPVKTRKLVRKSKSSWFLQLVIGGQILLVKRPQTGVWAGLMSLPEFESEQALSAWIEELAGQQQTLVHQPVVKHALTHFDWFLQPVQWKTRSVTIDGAELRRMEARWVSLDQLDQVGLPAPFKKMLSGFEPSRSQ